MRIGKQEWGVIHNVRRLENASVSEAINYLARFRAVYPVDLEIAQERLRSIEAHTELIEVLAEYLIAVLYELENAVAALDPATRIRLPAEPGNNPGETPAAQPPKAPQS